ncbi:hypothetical protein KKA27_00960, partial [Patescibacteria group bacterium]|nr:hypothetical protein [Patescibacteria group bacterium]
TYLKASQKVFIEQMYLKSKEENEERRIRKRYQEKMGSAYYQTFKESVPSIKRSEREEMISALEFFQLQKLILPGTSPVVKNRFCFMYKNQYFELDQILSPKKMWLLEIELTEENDKLELPPFLKIEKEVTGDKKYSNYEISKNN